MTDLQGYFEEKQGLGVLATANREGLVNSAVYARPTVIDGETVVFLMAEHRSVANVRENPYASYLFREEGPGYRGIRLTLERIAEEQNPGAVAEFRKRVRPVTYRTYADQNLRVVTFRVLESRPLVGDLDTPE